MDFYILSASDDDAGKLHFACRLAEKAYQLKTSVHLHTASATDAQRLDSLLWTFRQGSFVPHEIMTPAADAQSPVTIGCGDDAPPVAGLLINLTDSMPSFAMQFTRVAEIVAGDESSKACARNRFRSYQSLGSETVTHRMENAS